MCSENKVLLLDGTLDGLKQAKTVSKSEMDSEPFIKSVAKKERVFFWRIWKDFHLKMLICLTRPLHQKIDHFMVNMAVL